MCLGVVLDHNGEEDNEDDTDDKQRAYKSVFVELATGVITMKKYIIKKKYVFINVCLIVVGFFCMVSRIAYFGFCCYLLRGKT